MPVTKFLVEDVFTYHAPNEEQIKKLQAVRESAKALANTILDNTPTCADQQASLRLLRESVMTANASIVLKGLVALLLALTLSTSALAADTCPCPPEAPKTAPVKSVKTWQPAKTPVAPTPAPVPVVVNCPACPAAVAPAPVIVEKPVEKLVYLTPEPKGQWYLFPTVFYEDRLGVGFGPGYKLKNGVILMGQVLYRDPATGSSPTTLRVGCASATCPGCSDQAGWGAAFTVGVPLP